MPLLASHPLTLAIALTAATAAPTEVLRVEGDAAALRAIAREHDHVVADYATGKLLLEADAQERARLQGMGLRVRSEPAASAALERSAAHFVRAKAGIPGYACYRTVTETEATLGALATAHPQLASVIDIGDSWEKVNALGGRDLRVLKLTNAAVPGPKPAMFLMGAIHAREYTTAELVLRFAEQLVQGHGVDADATWLLDQHEIHVLVQTNPDGRAKAETGLSWRKNTNQSYCGATSNSRGADLNRNFPFEWGAHGGSSPVPCESTYRGAGPGSEPETDAVVDYVRAILPDQRGPLLGDPAPVDAEGMFLDIHSFSRLVLWPWGFDDIVAPNGPALETLGRRFAWFNNYTPEQAIDLYATDGTTDDFAYGELGVPAYTFELGTAFFESCANFENTIAPANLPALRYAARVTRRPYRLPAGPEARDVALSPDLVVPGETVTLAATVDDSRFSQANGGSQPIHAVVSASASIGAAPWQAGASPQPLLALDGAYDEANEAVGATLSTTGSSVGRQLVFVQGRDATGADGAASAAFVTLAAAADIGTLTGTVRSLGNGQPLAADVVAGSWSTQADAISGTYTRRVLAGAYDVVVSAPHHETATVAVAVAGGETRSLHANLFALCPRLDEAAESGAGGWTTQVTSGQAWAIVGPNAITPTRAWHDSPTGNYASNSNTALLSPAVDLAGYVEPVLSFASRCDTEAGFDYGIVEVRASASAAWSEVFRCDGDPTWRGVVVPVPQLAGAAAAQVRFRLTSDGGVNDDGWHIDDIVLEAGGAACRAQQDFGFGDGFE